ncbi:hypothetical protein J437_LFUL006249 [Ladona fulva]|uniref:Uncharacterized protein n=1 Tax=Ladona fulva TaxID=123851 RepID=A0A8K0K5U6_LADFU|nr:hypothetical protein J437_LFUL006249 [Ladona fulva]
MMFKNHLDTIGRNEPIQRKAKFWQSYVRALKGPLKDHRGPAASSDPYLTTSTPSRPSWTLGPTASPSTPIQWSPSSVFTCQATATCLSPGKRTDIRRATCTQIGTGPVCTTITEALYRGAHPIIASLPALPPARPPPATARCCHLPLPIVTTPFDPSRRHDSARRPRNRVYGPLGNDRTPLGR